MFALLWLVPILPFAGFAVLALGGRRLSRSGVAIIGVGSVGLSALLTIVLAISFIAAAPTGHAYTHTLWTWFDDGGLAPAIAFRLDPLSLIMAFFVTAVGTLIHLYPS